MLLTVMSLLVSTARLSVRKNTALSFSHSSIENLIKTGLSLSFIVAFLLETSVKGE